MRGPSLVELIGGGNSAAITVAVKKQKLEILAEGPDSSYLQGLPWVPLLYARALIGRTNRG